MLRWLGQRLRRQRGAFSPFMFGLLAGVAIFSATLRAKAELELQRIEKAQAERRAEETTALRRAVENALMTETSATAGTLPVDRIRAAASKQLGKTRGGQDLVMGKINTNTALSGERIIITNSDDAFVRKGVSALDGNSSSSMATSDLTNREDVITIDTAGIRAKQVDISMQNMRAASELVYAWYANPVNDLKFPDNATYTNNIANNPNAPAPKDFWGNNFTYTKTNDQFATLSFTPPWGGTAYTLKMDLQE